VYTFFFTYLSPCVACTACYVFSSVSITTFFFPPPFSTHLIDTYVTVPIHVRINLRICLIYFSIYIFICLLPTYVYIYMYTHFPPPPYPYTLITMFICMFGVLFYIDNHLDYYVMIPYNLYPPVSTGCSHGHAWMSTQCTVIQLE